MSVTINNCNTLLIQYLQPYIDGILPKGPYPPCLRMAYRALLAGYPPYANKVYLSLVLSSDGSCTWHCAAVVGSKEVICGWCIRRIYSQRSPSYYISLMADHGWGPHGYINCAGNYNIKNPKISSLIILLIQVLYWYFLCHIVWRMLTFEWWSGTYWWLSVRLW